MGMSSTYNAIDLGDFVSTMSPTENFRMTANWFNTTEGLFDKNESVITFEGGDVRIMTFKFVKNKEDTPAFTNQLDFTEWFNSFADSLRPAIGSQSGATLYLDIVTRSLTINNVFIRRLTTSVDKQGYMIIEAEFMWSNS